MIKPLRATLQLPSECQDAISNCPLRLVRARSPSPHLKPAPHRTHAPTLDSGVSRAVQALRHRGRGQGDLLPGGVAVRHAPSAPPASPHPTPPPSCRRFHPRHLHRPRRRTHPSPPPRPLPRALSRHHLPRLCRRRRLHLHRDLPLYFASHLLAALRLLVRHAGRPSLPPPLPPPPLPPPPLPPAPSPPGPSLAHRPWPSPPSPSQLSSPRPPVHFSLLRLALTRHRRPPAPVRVRAGWSRSTSGS